MPPASSASAGSSVIGKPRVPVERDRARAAARRWRARRRRRGAAPGGGRRPRSAAARGGDHGQRPGALVVRRVAGGGAQRRPGVEAEPDDLRRTSGRRPRPGRARCGRGTRAPPAGTLSSDGSVTSTAPRSWICTSSFTNVPESRPPSDQSKPGSASAIIGQGDRRQRTVGAGEAGPRIGAGRVHRVADRDQRGCHRRHDHGACRPTSASATAAAASAPSPTASRATTRLEAAQARRQPTPHERVPDEPDDRDRPGRAEDGQHVSGASGTRAPPRARPRARRRR